MALLKLTALGLLAYAGYKLFATRETVNRSALANAEDYEGNFARVRDSGPAAMRDVPRRAWDRTDEACDQSFPASDPPANY